MLIICNLDGGSINQLRVFYQIIKNMHEHNILNIKKFQEPNYRFE